jgi:methionine synthase II (cobalamin-independent)
MALAVPLLRRWSELASIVILTSPIFIALPFVPLTCMDLGRALRAEESKGSFLKLLAALFSVPKALIPGVVESKTSYVEHAELVAQRIGRYARLVGRENVAAGTNRGFGREDMSRRHALQKRASIVSLTFATGVSLRA